MICAYKKTNRHDWVQAATAPNNSHGRTSRNSPRTLQGPQQHLGELVAFTNLCAFTRRNQFLHAEGSSHMHCLVSLHRELSEVRPHKFFCRSWFAVSAPNCRLSTFITASTTLAVTLKKALPICCETPHLYKEFSVFGWNTKNSDKCTADQFSERGFNWGKYVFEK